MWSIGIVTEEDDRRPSLPSSPIAEAARPDGLSWSCCSSRRSTSCCRRSSGSRTPSASSATPRPVWIVVALGFDVADVLLLRRALPRRGRRARRPTSSGASRYQITMAGLAATRLFSAGGAGGIVLTYWALRKAGMERRQTACRMVAFLVLLYAVYMVALIIFGILLRTGVLHGRGAGRADDRPGGDRRRAILVVGLLIALIPDDLERRLGALRAGIPVRGASRSGWPAPRRRSPAAPARRSPSSATRRGAASRWSARSASGRPTSASSGPRFHAFGVHVPLGVVVQGFFVGMVANLFPFAPGGVGAVDAGMIGAFVLFGLPERRGLRGGAHLPADRLLAADPARDRRLLPAAQDRRALGGGAGRGAGRPTRIGEPLPRRGRPLLQKVKYDVYR